MDYKHYKHKRTFLDSRLKKLHNFLYAFSTKKRNSSNFALVKEKHLNNPIVLKTEKKY